MSNWAWHFKSRYICCSLVCYLQVIAFTCCSITVILLLGALGDASWVQSEGWREGLFTQCVKAGAPTPLPFGAEATPGCRRAHSAGYVRGAAALMIIGFMTDFFGTLLTGLGLRSTDPNKKYKYYRVAIYAFTAAGNSVFSTFENSILEFNIFQLSLCFWLWSSIQLHSPRIWKMVSFKLEFLSMLQATQQHTKLLIAVVEFNFRLQSSSFEIVDFFCIY